MRLISRFMRFFFHHFYHSFAWSYDFVAAVVSIGRWNDWTRTIIPFIQGTNILEIGPGPGYLQRILSNRGLSIFGLDESLQMIRLAKNRLEKADYKTINLARGLAQTLPFPDAKFDSVISTFPSEYISDSKRYLKSVAFFETTVNSSSCLPHGLLDANSKIERRRGYFKLPVRRQRISSRSS